MFFKLTYNPTAKLQQLIISFVDTNILEKSEIYFECIVAVA